MSPGVAPAKDVWRWKWEVSCAPYQLGGNILYLLYGNDLWKTALLKEAENLSKPVTLPTVKNGKLAAIRVVRKGIYAKAA
jgi:hypothetical protein